MASSLSQLSASFARLSSLERRFIILVLVIIFIVINLLFVLPHFNDLGKIDNRFADANAKLDKYQKEIAQVSFYETNIKKWEGEGSAVAQEDQSVSLLGAIQTHLVQSGVTMLNQTRQPTRTNQFFLEAATALTTQSGEAQLVDFLYNLGSGGSMIRARALSVRPEMPQRQALTATMTLVASFQKKPSARTTPAAKSSTPGAKPPTSTPATAPASKPATSAVPVIKTNRPAGSLPASKSITPSNK